MNFRTNYPFDAADVRRFKYENAVFVALLQRSGDGKLMPLFS